MKKFLLLLFAICPFCNAFAQHFIVGKVVIENGTTLPGASVYLNNTTIGTATDENGEFKLEVSEGNYTLVVSFLGYKPQELSITSESFETFHTIKLAETAFDLGEVIITKETFGEEWQYNLIRFKETFLGRTELAKTCKILNEKDLRFNYDAKTNMLIAFAHRPLKIRHKGLGYLITYDLVDFFIKGNYSFFSGYSRFQNLRKHIRKKWKINRKKAYNGSQMHFFRSLMANKVQENGFIVNQFKRVKNPKRPTESAIKKAYKLLMLHNEPIEDWTSTELPKTKLDSARFTITKAKLPKYKDLLYKQNVPCKDMISYKNETAFLYFENHLMVIYLNEPEEENYRKGFFSKEDVKPVQTSNFILTKGKVGLDNSGVLRRVDAIINEGYWAFEAFATMLPFDYKP